MWTWLSWELPGRCETASERLYEKSLLSAQALGIDIVGGSSAASGKTVTPQLEAPSPQKQAVRKQPAARSSARRPSSDDDDITIAGLGPVTSGPVTSGPVTSGATTSGPETSGQVTSAK